MTVAVVTGANQGLGFALAAGLAERLEPADLVLLTGRNPERVQAAAASLASARARVEGRVLDVSSPEDVAAFAKAVGAVDIVISNASAMLTPERSQAAQVDEFVAVANGGAQAVLRSFGPISRPGGRLIVVASSLGTLGRLDPRVQPLLDGVSLDEVSRVVDEWVASVHDGTAVSRGWPEWINIPSKVAQVAAVRAVAAERRERDLAEGTLVAAVCPGLVDTPLSRPWFEDFSQARTPAAAAVPILDLVFAPVDPARYGELIRDGEVLPWRSGRPVQVAKAN
ncbi:SDR family NAD(P)-dependent oxidoreductase [Actinocrispum sp. NPDC049592]|uniref:SDR family NAD(P)-dependent oxidoreductase n=1 Tax=Actinocrispum sp. NPDC049592 TaxID=3154835 RepID=UPI0034254D7A